MHLILPASDPVLPWTALIVGFGLWIPCLYYWGLNQFITQRALASQSLKQGQYGMIFAAVLKALNALAHHHSRNDSGAALSAACFPCRFKPRPGLSAPGSLPAPCGTQRLHVRRDNRCGGLFSRLNVELRFNYLHHGHFQAALEERCLPEIDCAGGTNYDDCVCPDWGLDRADSRAAELQGNFQLYSGIPGIRVARSAGGISVWAVGEARAGFERALLRWR